MDAQQKNLIIKEFPGIATFAPFLEEAFDFASLDTPIRQASFLAQCAHETGRFTTFTEDLSRYSAKRLSEVWKERFAIDKIAGKPNQLAYEHEYKPVKLANYVYGGRYGNKAPGDGWKYRGRFWMMLTFKDNYKEVDRLLGLRGELVLNPEEFLNRPRINILTGAAFWRMRKLNKLVEDPKELRKRIQGGDLGADAVSKYRSKLFQILT